MKRLLSLILPLALLLCGCGRSLMNTENPPATGGEQTAQPTETPTPEPPAPQEWAGLTMEDLSLSPLERNSDGWLTGPLTEEEAENLYPGIIFTGMETYEEGAARETVNKFFYGEKIEDDRELTIITRGEDGRVDVVTNVGYEGAEGPRGIRCGMDFHRVMALFEMTVIPWDGPYYEEFFTGETDSGGASYQAVTLPPKVTVNRTGEVTVMDMICPVQPYPQDMEQSEYEFQKHYMISLIFDKEGVLIYWSWRIGAFVE